MKAKLLAACCLALAAPTAPRAAPAGDPPQGPGEVDRARFNEAAARLRERERERAEAASAAARRAATQAAARPSTRAAAPEAPPPAGPYPARRPDDGLGWMGAAPGEVPAPRPRPLPVVGPPGRVVFVCETRGAMMQSFPASVVPEVLKATGELGPGRLFNVVLCSAERVRPFAGAPIPATEANRQALAAFLSAESARGGPDLAGGIRLALTHKPDLVWVAADVNHENPVKLLAEVRAMNAAGVRINVVQFQDSPPSAFLWQLAHDAGGVLLGPDGKVVKDVPGGPAPVTLPKGPSIFRQ